MLGGDCHYDVVRHSAAISDANVLLFRYCKEKKISTTKQTGNNICTENIVAVAKEEEEIDFG